MKLTNSPEGQLFVKVYHAVHNMKITHLILEMTAQS